ncbi:hypothetical protein HanXRQr2_Chr17g0792311 [Helianthus annuus]|uniref:Uncharacterized protein n=1 Tax=Helianthus annuus TaxID=4232 RepID=A0A251RMM0_HELAN|nr:hypothetical protein HanXRQr2_Chr17g0792311 [Helianthus annuus]KAJ0432499.1 hypothetical protein HanIR_Chr17g0859891 [Helianthus annuus]KAJ0812281.1 hypothetical protein HanPSC8_Chr17g0760261 [Helianthus annuus]
MLYRLYGFGYTLFSYPHLYFSTCNIINKKKGVQMRSREKERDLKRERPRWKPTGGGSRATSWQRLRRGVGDNMPDSGEPRVLPSSS